MAADNRGARRGNRARRAAGGRRSPAPDSYARLVAAVIDVECSLGLIAWHLAEARTLHATCGPPRPADLPANEEARAARGARLLAEAGAHEPGSDAYTELLELAAWQSPWLRLLECLVRDYLELLDRVRGAERALGKVVGVLGAALDRDGKPLVGTCRALLADVHGALHPSVVGGDGIGLVRVGPEGYASAVRELAARTQNCRVDLQAHRRAGDAWMTVTEAADLLARDLLRPGTRLKGVVSRAATAGEFVTNGLTGADRRIEPLSFDAWRLKKRDADLAKDA